MSTIGTATQNLIVNMPADEKAIYGQLAFPEVQRGRWNSTGDFVRHLLLLGLEKENKRAAREVRKIRIRYYAGSLLGVLVAPIVAAALQAFGLVDLPDTDSDPMRRVRTVCGVRIIRQYGSTRLEMEVA